MAHFYGGVQGNRGRTTRCGSIKSGMTSFVQGWDKGVAVQFYYDSETEEDHFRVFETSGSSSNGARPNTSTLIYDSKNIKEDD